MPYWSSVQHQAACLGLQDCSVLLLYAVACFFKAYGIACRWCSPIAEDIQCSVMLLFWLMEMCCLCTCTLQE